MSDRLNALKTELEWAKSQQRMIQKNIESYKRQIEEIENRKCANCNQISSSHPVVTFINVDEYSIEREFQDHYISPIIKRLPTSRFTFDGGAEGKICKEFQNSSSSLTTSP